MSVFNLKYSQKNIDKIRNAPSPRVLLNVCTHGDERVGLKIAKYFEKYPINKGILITNIANHEALRKNKRFMVHDLNRVFPGKRNGSYEEKLAYAMRPFIEVFDFVIDVHSTKTGVDSSLIVERLNKKMREIISAILPRRVLIMRATKSNALISASRSAVAFEYGKDSNQRTYIETVKGIESVLRHFKMINLKVRKQKRLTKIEFYDVFKSIAKPQGFVVSKEIRNFKIIKKGQIIGVKPETGQKIHAKFDFYPILFGNNTYKSIFGFAARKK